MGRLEDKQTVDAEGGKWWPYIRPMGVEHDGFWGKTAGGYRWERRAYVA